MKIEKGIKPPKRAVKTYRWAKLKINDSFTVANDPVTKQKLFTAASTYKRRHPPWNYTTQVEGDLLRVWRIK
jgi:hypothetical protein